MVMKKHIHRSTISRVGRNDEDLKSKANMAGGKNFEEYVRENRKIIIPFISHKFKTMGMIDLTYLPNEAVSALIQWILRVNRPRIESGQEIIVNYDIIKTCPIWKVVKMPYRVMKLLGTQHVAKTQSVRETQSGVGSFNNAKKAIQTKKPR